MAEILDKWDFRTTPGGVLTPDGSVSHPDHIYPWDEWTDGSIYLIVQGVDYNIPTFHMQLNIQNYARNHGLKHRKTRIRVGLECKEAVVFQFRPKRYDPMDTVAEVADETNWDYWGSGKNTQFKDADDWYLDDED